MENCAIIINSLSGNSSAVDENSLIEIFGAGYKTTVIRIYEDTVLGDLSIFERIVFCGGDGTLNSVINCKLLPRAQLFYLPYGTFNESEHGVDKAHPQFSELGIAGDRHFSYVCAAGIFTPLGYVVPNKKKKRWKKLAYFSRILKEYRIHRINAKFTLNGVEHQGEYSLLMAIDSKQCFGFKFNKMFEIDDGILHFLAIKAPKHNGLLGKISLFFPLFRTFFVGYKKPRHTKSVLFEPCKSVSLSLSQTVPFDMDGERVDMEGSFDISIVQKKYKIQIVNRNKLEQLKTEMQKKNKKKRKVK